MNFLSAQMILSWTLLGVLLAWMFSCAFLAFWPYLVEKQEAADLPTPSGAFSAIVPRTPSFTHSSPITASADSMPAVSTETEPGVSVAPMI